MRKLLFCLFFLCFPWLWLRAQQGIAFARLPPFERAVVCVKFFEGFHGKGCYLYVDYRLQLFSYKSKSQCLISSSLTGSPMR